MQPHATELFLHFRVVTGSCRGRNLVGSRTPWRNCAPNREINMTIKTGLTALALACSLVAGPALAKTIDYTTTLTGKDEVPANTTKGKGTVTAKYDTDTKVLTWKIEYSGLTGPVTAAHFHGPAKAGKNADPIIPLTGELKSPIEGTATLTDEQAKELADGEIYFNLHTAAHKGGEVRGQMGSVM